MEDSGKTGRLAGLAMVVTGAASGFGKGIAEAAAAAGAKVVLADLDGAAAETVSAELRARGADCLAVETDVTRADSLAAAVDLCEARYGGLDVMVANAGIGQRPAALLDTAPETLRRQLDVNALGVVLTCQAALPALRRRGAAGTSILITVSGIALKPRPQLYGYGMAKAAALYLMKALALELAPEGIRVNGLFPAVGDTPMLADFAGGSLSAEAARGFAEALPLGRLIAPADVGAAAVFLSSPREAGAITGCTLPVDAGRCI